MAGGDLPKKSDGPYSDLPTSRLQQYLISISAPSDHIVTTDNILEPTLGPIDDFGLTDFDAYMFPNSPPLESPISSDWSKVSSSADDSATFMMGADSILVSGNREPSHLCDNTQTVNDDNRESIDSHKKVDSNEKFHMFVKYWNGSQHQLGDFSSTMCTRDWSLRLKPTSSENMRIATMRNISLHDSLYTLSYLREPDAQVFSSTLKSSVDGDSVCLPLNNPPVILKQFSMCGLQLQVYTLNAIDTVYSNSSTPAFSSDELTRGIYVYHCSIDKWLPVPEMKYRVSHAILTTDGERLFSIGGRCDETRPCTLCRHVQAYDPRTGVWEALSDTKYYYSNSFSDAKVFGEKSMYTFNMDHRKTEKYDMVAGKWQVIETLYEHIFTECQLHDPKFYSYGECRLVPCRNKMYLFGIGTQVNPVWELNTSGLHALHTVKLARLNNVIPDLNRCSLIYDVGFF